MTVFKEPHRTVFEDSLSEGLLPDDLGGKSWRVFTNGLDGIDPDSFEPADTDKGKISRSEIFALAADDRVRTPTVCAAVLAWGGMYMTYHKELFNQADAEWLEVADQLRQADCSAAVRAPFATPTVMLCHTPSLARSMISGFVRKPCTITTSKFLCGSRMMKFKLQSAQTGSLTRMQNPFSSVIGPLG